MIPEEGVKHSRQELRNMPRGIKYMKNMCSLHFALDFLFLNCLILCCLSVERARERLKTNTNKKTQTRRARDQQL
jgi:hypothetical protein